jgi:hypothetical protein
MKQPFKILFATLSSLVITSLIVSKCTRDEASAPDRDNSEGNVSPISIPFLGSPKMQKVVNVITDATSNNYSSARDYCMKQGISQDDLNNILQNGGTIVSSTPFTKSFRGAFDSYTCTGSSYVVEGPEKIFENLP